MAEAKGQGLHGRPERDYGAAEMHLIDCLPAKLRHDGLIDASRPRTRLRRSAHAATMAVEAATILGPVGHGLISLRSGLPCQFCFTCVDAPAALIAPRFHQYAAAQKALRDVGVRSPAGFATMRGGDASITSFRALRRRIFVAGFAAALLFGAGPLRLSRSAVRQSLR